jgi:protein ImuB
MLWACLYFSDLPLRAVFDDSELAQPCAVVEGPQQRQQVTFVNASAQRDGVRAGHVLAAARALCARMQARARDTAAEKRLLQSFAAWAYRFSSQIALSEPDALLIEVGASLNLFGGWPALQRCLGQELARIGYTPAIAMAPVAAAARILAARHDGFFAVQPAAMLAALAAVPIAGSGLAKDAITLLYNVGLRTLREVFALPRPELARRIGPQALIALDRLRGSAQEALKLYRPPDRFAHRIEFDHHIEAWPPLLFPLRRLCGELELFLTARDGGVQRCELVLEHEDRAATRIPVELLAPQREARTLYELLRSRLERVALAAPVSGIALIAKELPPLCPRHKDLFESRREQQLDWPELAERLRAHLGDESVRQLAIVAEHRPERAWGFAASKQTLAELRPRPTWLLARALPLRGAPPKILAGPERIESGWWDGDDARRDYYVVQTQEGQRAWAYLPAGANDSWMLHGWFA